MSFREEQMKYKKYKSNVSKNQYRCANCGRTINIHRSVDKALCPSCGKIIERNEKNNIEHITFISRLQMSYYRFQRRLHEQIYN